MTDPIVKIVRPWFKNHTKSPGLKRRNRNKVNLRSRRLGALGRLLVARDSIATEAAQQSARFRRIKEEIAVLEKRLVA